MNKVESAHNEYGDLKVVYLKHPEQSMIDQIHINDQWENLNYLSCPDYSKALVEYEMFEEIIKSSGTEIRYFDRDDLVTMDSMYCRDASLATDYGIILGNMGKAPRKNEPDASEKNYRNHNEVILGRITSPGTLEGGDVCWLDERTLAVAHSYRTNSEGFQQLKKMLEPYEIKCLQFDLPHYKGKNDVFHLMSILSPVDRNKVVVYSPLMPIKLRMFLLKNGYELIEVPEQEFEPMACNVLAIAPSVCVLLEGNPVTQYRLEDAGCKVLTYSGNEISIKGGGGPTCLTRPLSRKN